MKGFLSGVMVTLLALLALFLAPEQSPFEAAVARRFPTHVPSPSQPVAVFITGCSSGIGLHAARFLAERGYDVFATVRREADVPALTNQPSPQDGSTRKRMHPIICDVTDVEQVQGARDEISEWLSLSDDRVFGGIVNNAGVVSPLVMFQNMPAADLHYVLQVNLFGPFTVYQTFLPLIRQYQGRILNIGSLSGIAARPFRGPYTVSKFALEGFSDTIRQELMLEDISVSMINPGFIQTKFAEKGVKTSHDIYGDTATREDLTAVQRDLLEAFEAKYVQTLADAPTPLETSKAIYHALSDPKPRTRYYPGSIGIGSVPAWILPKLRQILPDRLIDLTTVKITAPKGKQN